MVFECFSFYLFHRPFELKFCNVSFLARKSHAVCDGLLIISCLTHSCL